MTKRIVASPHDEIVPLRTAAQDAELAPDDRLLADGLAALYSAPPPGARVDPTDGWARLQGEAQRLARQRRRSYLLRELFSAWTPRPLQLVAACLLIGIVLTAADRPLRAPAQTPSAAPTAALSELVLASSRASFAAVSRTLRLRVGAELKIEHGTVAIEQADRAATRIALTSGEVRLHVPPLPGRGKLVVATSDAEVIVHGTRFSVRKIDALSTAVAVDEGLVEVRPQGGGRGPVFLRPGESLIIPGLARYEKEIEARAKKLIDAGRCEDPEHSIESYLTLMPAGADVSAAQYLQGFCAAQRKDADDAIRWFERAAVGSQDGVRADNALARAAKLRADRSESDGTAAWRRYLERFPHGLHRESAARFLSGAR